MHRQEDRYPVLLGNLHNRVHLPDELLRPVDQVERVVRGLPFIAACRVRGEMQDSPDVEPVPIHRGEVPVPRPRSFLRREVHHARLVGANQEGRPPVDCHVVVFPADLRPVRDHFLIPDAQRPLQHIGPTVKLRPQQVVVSFQFVRRDRRLERPRRALPNGHPLPQQLPLAHSQHQLPPRRLRPVVRDLHTHRRRLARPVAREIGRQAVQECLLHNAVHRLQQQLPPLRRI